MDDVNADPRYLACSLETQSEIVVPIMSGGRVLGEIDIDSDRQSAFGAADRELLEAVAARLARTPSERRLAEPCRTRRTRLMSYTITLIPGDGIGPEVTEAVVRIFKVARIDIEWDRHDAGVTAFKRHNQSLPARCSTPSAGTRSRSRVR